jgi:disulfide bond formation protein DsbB
MESYEIIGKIFGIGVLLLQLSMLALIVMYLVWPNCWGSKIVKKYSLYFVAFLGIMSIVGSLTYSEFVKFDPCKLCWVQRIFLYPTAFIALLAIWRRDTGALWYTLVLSVIGACFSLYHYMIQIVPVSSALPCSATGEGGCGGFYVIEMGYITIPMMALTLSMFIILLSIIGIRNDKENN